MQCDGGQFAEGATLNGLQAISADGRYVVMTARIDLSLSSEIYRKDMLTGELRLVLAGAEDPQSSGNHASISADGRYVAFDGGGAPSPAHPSALADVFVRDMQTGVLILASQNVANSASPFFAVIN